MIAAPEMQVNFFCASQAQKRSAPGRNHEGGIMKAESRRRNHEGRITKAESRRRNLPPSQRKNSDVPVQRLKTLARGHRYFIFHTIKLYSISFTIAIRASPRAAAFASASSRELPLIP